MAVTANNGIGLRVVEAIDKALESEQPQPTTTVDIDTSSMVIEAMDRHYYILEQIKNLPLTESDSFKQRNVDLYKYFYLKSLVEAAGSQMALYAHRPSDNPANGDYRNGYKAGWKHSHQGGQISQGHIAQLAQQGHSQQYIEGYQHGHGIRTAMASAIQRGEAAGQAIDQHSKGATNARSQARDLAARGFRPEHPEMQQVMQQHDQHLAAIDQAANERVAAHNELFNNVVAPHYNDINKVFVRLPRNVEDNMAAWSQNYDDEAAKTKQSPIHGVSRSVLNNIDAATADPKNDTKGAHPWHAADLPQWLGQNTENLVRHGGQQVAVAGGEDKEKLEKFRRAQGVGGKRRGRAGAHGAPSGEEDKGPEAFEAGDREEDGSEEDGEGEGEGEEGGEGAEGGEEGEVPSGEEGGLEAGAEGGEEGAGEEGGEEGEAPSDDSEMLQGSHSAPEVNDEEPEHKASPTGVEGVDSDHLEYIMRHAGRGERMASIAKTLKLPPEKVVKAFRLEIARRQDAEEKAEKAAAEKAAAEKAAGVVGAHGERLGKAAARREAKIAAAQKQPAQQPPPAQGASPEKQASEPTKAETPEKEKTPESVKSSAPKSGDLPPDQPPPPAAGAEAVAQPEGEGADRKKKGARKALAPLAHDPEHEEFKKHFLEKTKAANFGRRQFKNKLDPNGQPLVFDWHKALEHMVNHPKGVMGHGTLADAVAAQGLPRSMAGSGSISGDWNGDKKVGRTGHREIIRDMFKEHPMWSKYHDRPKKEDEDFEETGRSFKLLESESSIFDDLIEDDVVAGGTAGDDDQLDDQPEAVRGEGDEDYADDSPKKSTPPLKRESSFNFPKSMFDQYTKSIFDDIVSK